MIDINKILSKRFNHTGDFNIDGLKDYINEEFPDVRADMLIGCINGRNPKNLAKEYHIAESRITNLLYATLDKYYKAHMCG